jgi:hypothetical protein
MQTLKMTGQSDLNRAAVPLAEYPTYLEIWAEKKRTGVKSFHLLNYKPSTGKL